ncbi:DUF4199 domain-containing protein [Pedobacter namyangjuensis]|uniref:DUF4199 domain-containing protein n=1 Tax=Pedobacter namyangjuensis TaxID=600626 RepID=UPI000DE1C363|nr:DUF4199 domain-containing protein [Pedobacter namyangjuensis]
MEQQLLQEQIKPNALAFKVSVIFAAYILVTIIVTGLLNLDMGPTASVATRIISGALNWLPFIFAVYYVQNTHKKDLGGFITYGRAFSAGFRFSVYAGLFTGILMFLYYQFIDAAAMEKIVDATVAAAKNDQEAKGIEMMRPYFTISTAFGAAVMFTISGLIISLITAAILKKEKPLHYDEA